MLLFFLHAHRVAAKSERVNQSGGQGCIMTNSCTLTIESMNVRLPEAMQLIARLTAELAQRYHDDGTGNFNFEDVEIPRSGFLVARWNGQAVACGALRPLSESVAEIKRMYVEPTFRGRGIGKRILAALEAAARKADYKIVRLETGTSQPEALALYEGAGYHRITNYGFYRHDPRSVCFEKDLGTL
jgi:GNAT superfamily N-acetyltransferase